MKFQTLALGPAFLITFFFVTASAFADAPDCAGLFAPPKLRIVDHDVRKILLGLADPETLVVVDSFSAGQVPTSVRKVVVRDNDERSLADLRSVAGDYKRVIGLGSCTALDAAKTLAHEEGEIYLVPTLISTACISVDKSVIRIEGVSRAVKTALPTETIVPIPLLMESPYPLRKRMSSAGFGDILARLGAAAETAHRAGISIATREIQDAIPDTAEVLAWIESNFRDYDENCIKKLAVFSHDASLVTMINRELGKTGFTVGGEHRLYYWMVDHLPRYQTSRYRGLTGKTRFAWDLLRGNTAIASHGEIVAAGTLVLLRKEAELSGNFEVYERTVRVYDKLSLPTTERGLAKIGIFKPDMIAGIKAVAKEDDLFGVIAREEDFKILDRTFPRD